jgi:prophage regulatory protein
MSLRDQTLGALPNLIGLMTDAQGGVLPHADSIRPIAPPLPSAEIPHASAIAAELIHAGPWAVASVASKDARGEADRDAAIEAAQVAQRQVKRREVRRAARVESYGKKVPLNAGGGSAAPLTMSPASDIHYLSVKQVARRFGVGVATIWRWSKAHPDFPKPVRPGPGVTRWLPDEIAVFESKLKERR